MRRVDVVFQAEDGIRDSGVTGVQTCALPISTCTPRNQGGSRRVYPSAACPEVAASTMRLPGAPRSRRRSGRSCRTSSDRKSVVLGKSVDLGGRGIIKKHYLSYATLKSVMIPG